MKFGRKHDDEHDLFAPPSWLRDAPAPGPDGQRPQAIGEIIYRLDEWHEQSRHALDTALWQAGVDHGWEDDTVLVVQAGDETQADKIVDAVEAEREPPLDASGDQLEWDLTPLDARRRVRVLDLVYDARIPYEMDGKVLVTMTADRERVAVIIDGVVADASGAGGGDRVDAVEAGLGSITSRHGALFNALFMPAAIIPIRGVVPPWPSRAGKVEGEEGAPPVEPLPEELDDGTADAGARVLAELDEALKAIADDPGAVGPVARVQQILDDDPPAPWGMSRAWWASVLSDARDMVELHASGDPVVGREATRQWKRLREYV